MIKVQKGTRSGDNLCKTCRNATVAYGARESHEFIYCAQIKKFIQFDVVECNQYDNTDNVPLYRLEQVAWILETDKHRRQIGFVPVKIWAKTHEDESVIPDRD